MHNDPTVLLSRRPRRLGEDWTTARSWLGGAPCLGSTPWPSGQNGRPLHFLAQIDLGELAAKVGATSLPAAGSLAFFVDDTRAVIYVPPSGDRKPTPPPANMPELAKSGSSLDWRTDLSGRPLYPFWPLDFTPLKLPSPSVDDDDEDHIAAQFAAVERHFKRRQYNLSAELAFPGPPIPDWWQTAIHLADDLGKALRQVPAVLRREQSMLDWAHEQVMQARSKGEAALKEAEASVVMFKTRIKKAGELEPAFLDFVTEVASWTAGRDPWSVMAPEDMARLAAYWARYPQFPDFTGHSGAVPVDVLKKKRMFEALPAAGDPSFAALPAAVRQLIDARRAPRPLWWHSALHLELEVAARLGVPLASKSLREALEADRAKLARLRPAGALGPVFRMVDGKSKERHELEARIKSNEAKLAERRPLEAAFHQFVQETSAWCDRRDPFSFMMPADIEELKVRVERAARDFREVSGVYYARSRIQDLEAFTLRVLATADNRGYATLPEQVRALINHEYLLPPGGWHQMFGRGVEIQGESGAMREEGYVMLLQLTHDDMVQWGFGDCGAYQFWISPEDLARRSWSAVKMTFECH